MEENLVAPNRQIEVVRKWWTKEMIKEIKETKKKLNEKKQKNRAKIRKNKKC